MQIRTRTISMCSKLNKPQLPWTRSTEFKNYIWHYYWTHSHATDLECVCDWVCVRVCVLVSIYAFDLTYRNIKVYLLFLLCFLRAKIINARKLPITPSPMTIKLNIKRLRLLYKAAVAVRAADRFVVNSLANCSRCPTVALSAPLATDMAVFLIWW